MTNSYGLWEGEPREVCGCGGIEVDQTIVNQGQNQSRRECLGDAGNADRVIGPKKRVPV